MTEWLGIGLPETSQAIWRWFVVIFTCYILGRKFVARLRGKPAPTNMARLSDAATFAGSLLLMIGVFNQKTMIAVGDTTAFLIIGGAGGLLYAAEQAIEEGKASK